MDLALRFCKKCKRNTLQVVEYVLTMDAARALSYCKLQYLEVKDPKNLERMKAADEKFRDRWKKETWYCPCCGKRWTKVESATTSMEEFKEPIYKIIE